MTATSRNSSCPGAGPGWGFAGPAAKFKIRCNVLFSSVFKTKHFSNLVKPGVRRQRLGTGNNLGNTLARPSAKPLANLGSGKMICENVSANYYNGCAGNTLRKTWHRQHHKQYFGKTVGNTLGNSKTDSRGKRIADRQFFVRIAGASLPCAKFCRGYCRCTPFSETLSEARVLPTDVPKYCLGYCRCQVLPKVLPVHSLFSPIYGHIFPDQAANFAFLTFSCMSLRCASPANIRPSLQHCARLTFPML